MKNINFNRLTILGCCIALVTLASVTHTIGQSIKGSTSNPIITIQPFLNISNWSPVPAAGTMLARKSDGIFMTANTAGLVPGTAVTAWFGVFNNPPILCHHALHSGGRGKSTCASLSHQRRWSDRRG